MQTAIDPITGEVLINQDQLQNLAQNPIVIAKTILARYENIAAMLETIKMDKDAARNAIIPDEIKADLESIDAEYDQRIQNGCKMLETIKKDLSTAAKRVGETVNGEIYQVIYKQGSWKIRDIEELLEYAVTHPDIMNYIEKSLPSTAVQIRRGGK